MGDIRNIARVAGVSPATVSRVLNGHPQVRAETRDKVMAAVAALGYRPRSPAAGLRHRSDFVGFVHFGLPGLAEGRMAEAVETTLFDAGFKTFSCTAGGDPAREAFYVGQLIERGVAGAILSPQGHQARAVAAAGLLAAAGIVPVLLAPAQLQPGLSQVALDAGPSWALGWRHLTGLGRRRIACLLSPEQQAMAVPEELVLQAIVADPAADPAQAAEAALASWDSVPDAVVCGTETLAVAMLRAVQRRGLRVPDQVAVLAMGGTDIARMTAPRLSVVSLPVQEMAQAAAQELLRRLQEPGSGPRKILFEARLIPGETTAPVKTA